MRCFLLLLFLVLSPLAQAAEPAAGPPALPDTYRPPQAMQDGWQIADARRGGWQVDRLQALETAIAKGEFPGVTSVVIAHQGKLVYERYFNGGGADVLNDTRSATKSVTALLLGAAIDRGHIPGAQAPVYAYFADMQPWQNPVPASSG